MESDAKFKDLIQEGALQLMEIENELRKMEQNIKFLLSIEEPLPADWLSDYKQLCMTYLIATPYGIMRFGEARDKVGGRELSDEEQVKAILGDHRRGFLNRAPRF